MQKITILLVALVAVIAISDAVPRNQYRSRPLARYQQKARYNPRYAQYTRYRSARLEEGEEAAEADLPAVALPEEVLVADLPEEANVPEELPALPEPLPAADEVPLSASPDESANREARLLPPAAAPSGNYFPLRFDGGLNGGFVAVANSFSTGNNGRSESRAVAGGSPVAVERRRH